MKIVSTLENHIEARLNFAQWGLTWSRERLYNQAFPHEFWAR